MTILLKPPADWKRPPIPVQVKLQVVINQEGRCKATGARLGLVKHVRFDHRPPLQMRRFNTETYDTVPPANDPSFIEAILSAAHDVRTFGPGGEKRATTRGGDITEIRRADRLSEQQEDFRRKILAREPGEKRKPRGKIPSRPNAWPKGRKIKSRGFEGART